MTSRPSPAAAGPGVRGTRPARAAPTLRMTAGHLVLGVAAAASGAGCRDAALAAGRVRSLDSEAGAAAMLVIAATAEPRSLLPPFATDLVAAQLCDQLYQRLAEPVAGFSTFGDHDYRPALASGWVWAPDSLSIRFRINAGARWHDGRPVTSGDVRFTYQLLRDPEVGILRPPLSDLIDSVTAPDPRTAVIWARRRAPNFFHEATFPVHILPAHLLDSIPRAALAAHARNRQPVGSGPFRFVRWLPGIQVELESVPRSPAAGAGHDGGVVLRAVHPERVVVRVLPSYEAAVAALQTGGADVVDYVRPDDALRLAGLPRMATLALPGFSYAVLQFNLRGRPTRTGAAPRGANLPGRAPGAGPAARPPHPVLGDSRVRRALALSIDRRALVGNLLHSLGFVSPGPVTRGQSTAGVAREWLPFDTAWAGRLLDSVGWVRPGPGAVRRRAGRPLAFAVLVPASSASRVGAAIILQQMLARVGARVEVERRDHASVVSDLERGDFDAALMALRVDPDPAGVRDAWGGEAARTSRGFNFGGYASAVTDSLLDSAARASDAESARRWYGRAYRQIVNDAPAVFLYEPVSTVMHDARWRPAGVRADAWWAGLENWTRR